MISIENCFVLLLFLITLKIKELHSQSFSEERCTRRFTAGYCIDPVRPVWTFMFQYQDCVIRMGCPPSPRVNRFGSYEQCMKHCKLLLDVYSQLLMGNHTSVYTLLRSRPWAQDKSRRESDKLSDQLNDADAINSKDYEVMVPDSYHANYFDSTEQASEDILPVDIDEDTERHHILDVFN